jgi:hypothetical protein
MQGERREDALRVIADARAVLRAAAVDRDLIVHAPMVRAWLAELDGWQIEGAGSKRVLARAREARGWLDTLAGWRAEVQEREDQRAREEAVRRARTVRVARASAPPPAGQSVAEASSGPRVGTSSLPPSAREAGAGLSGGPLAGRSSVPPPGESVAGPSGGPMAGRSSLPPPDPAIARRAFDGLDLGPNAAEIRRLAERFATFSPAEWLAATEAEAPAARDALELSLVEVMDRVPEARAWWDAIRAGSEPIAAQAAARYAAATGEQRRTVEHVRSVNTWEGSREMVRAEPLPPFQQRRFRETLEYALAAVMIRPLVDTG